MKIRALAGFAVLLLSVSAHAVSLQEYAKQNPLKIYTVAKGVALPLGDDQTNNLQEGDKVLELSGKNLTGVKGISEMTVEDAGHSVPLANVDRLHVFLNDNQIETLPAEIGQLKKVIFIYVMESRISVLPPEIAQMSSLEGVYFTGNHFTEIPPVLLTMSQLRKLQFSENQIKVMPPEIGNLTNLIHFNMSGNQIESLPDSIGKLENLRVCDLSDNRLTSLPESFGRVHIKYQLRVRNNPLTALPAGFAEMPGTIDITGTKIDINTLSPDLREKISTKKHNTKQSIVKSVPRN